MLNFHSPTINDKNWIEQKIAEMKFPTCEYSFGNIFTYTAKIDIKVADAYGCLITKCCFDDNYIGYCFPAGNGDTFKAVKFIIDDGVKSGIPFGIFGMNADNANFIKESCGDKFSIALKRDMSDYIYLSVDLINLRGKKYQPKRNHISFFKKNNNWTYERISEKNIPECIEMSRQWLENSQSEYKTELEAELKIILKAFENYKELGYVGGLLRIDGRVVAYTMGERINDNIFCVHFEKAFAQIRGAYPMINQQFVLNELSSYKYINREDDTGSENLRKAKLSYYPVILPEKYEATYIC